MQNPALSGLHVFDDLRVEFEGLRDALITVRSEHERLRREVIFDPFAHKQHLQHLREFNDHLHLYRIRLMDRISHARDVRPK